MQDDKLYRKMMRDKSRDLMRDFLKQRKKLYGRGYFKNIASKAAAGTKKVLDIAKKVKAKTGFGLSDLGQLLLAHPKVQAKLGKHADLASALGSAGLEAAEQKGYGQKGGRVDIAAGINNVLKTIGVKPEGLIHIAQQAVEFAKSKGITGNGMKGGNFLTSFWKGLKMPFQYIAKGAKAVAKGVGDVLGISPGEAVQLAATAAGHPNAGAIGSMLVGNGCNCQKGGASGRSYYNSAAQAAHHRALIGTIENDMQGLIPGAGSKGQNGYEGSSGSWAPLMTAPNTATVPAVLSF